MLCIVRRQKAKIPISFFEIRYQLGEISGDFPLIWCMDLYFGVNKGRFSGYAEQTPPIFDFFDPIGGKSPSIYALLHNNYELSGIFPSIYRSGD